MAPLHSGRIRHSVVFSLVHPHGSQRESEFLEAIAALSGIACVEAFELTREVSPKNEYRFGLTMEFSDRAAYRAYNEHPAHVSFVAARWDSEVSEFLEVDTVAL